MELSGKRWVVSDMDLFDIAVASKLAGGGGGGNPNTIQTVSGTAANPFGNIDKVALNAALLSNQATVKMELDFTVLGAGTVSAYIKGVDTSRYDNAFELSVGDAFVKSAGSMSWDDDGNILMLYMSQGDTSTNIKSYASNVPTSMTIIWHPLP